MHTEWHTERGNLWIFWWPTETCAGIPDGHSMCSQSQEWIKKLIQHIFHSLLCKALMKSTFFILFNKAPLQEVYLAESLVDKHCIDVFSPWIFFHLLIVFPSKLRSLLSKFTQMASPYWSHRGLCCVLLFGGYALLKLWSMALSQRRTHSIFFSRHWISNVRWAFGHVTCDFSLLFCCTSSAIKIFGPRLQYDSVWGQCKSLGFLHLLIPIHSVPSYCTQLLGLNR